MTITAVRTGTLISQELLDKLRAAFPAPRVQQDTPHEQIKWQAAQHEVVQWIEQYVGKQQTVENTEPENSRQDVYRPGEYLGAPAKATVRYGA